MVFLVPRGKCQDNTSSRRFLPNNFSEFPFIYQPIIRRCMISTLKTSLNNQSEKILLSCWQWSIIHSLFPLLVLANEGTNNVPLIVMVSEWRAWKAVCTPAPKNQYLLMVFYCQSSVHGIGELFCFSRITYEYHHLSNFSATSVISVENSTRCPWICSKRL
jgi:hypothetical protein